MAAIYSNGGITAGIFVASILLKEMRYLVYIRYLYIDTGSTSHLGISSLYITPFCICNNKVYLTVSLFPVS